MTPKRIQMRRTKGWRKPEGAIYVGRPSRWGNPFVVGDGPLSFHGYEQGCVGRYGVGGGRSDLEIPGAGLTPAMAVALYGDIIDDIMERPMDDLDQEVRSALAELRGHDLACWCPLDAPCHADVLLKVANA